ncbi:MAG TPA: type II secretion system protein GspG [Pyrinomonadaceae bacterium]
MDLNLDAQICVDSVVLLGALTFLLIVPTTVHADLSAKQARTAIRKTAGMSLPSSSVRVKKPVMVNPNIAETAAELDLVFRFVANSSGWRIAEVRTGQDRWEEIEGVTRAAGALLSPTECNNTDGFQPPATGDLTVKRARCLVAELFGIALPSDDVRIKSVSGLGLPLSTEPSAIAETQVRLAIRFAKDPSGWHTSAFKSGSRDWINIESVAASLDAAKASQAREDMKAIAAALETFRRERGGFVASDKHPALIDHLSPRYLRRVVRFDPWHNPYTYQGDRDRFTLRSAGPDGKQNTADDVVLSVP